LERLPGPVDSANCQAWFYLHFLSRIFAAGFWMGCRRVPADRVKEDVRFGPSREKARWPAEWGVVAHRLIRSSDRRGLLKSS
jgi:hypothetical protein